MMTELFIFWGEQFLWFLEDSTISGETSMVVVMSR